MVPIWWPFGSARCLPSAVHTPDFSCSAAHVLGVGEEPRPRRLQVRRRIKLPAGISRRAILRQGHKAEQNFVTNMRVRDCCNVAVRDLVSLIGKSDCAARAAHLVGRRLKLIAEPSGDRGDFCYRALANSFRKSFGGWVRRSLKRSTRYSPTQRGTGTFDPRSASLSTALTC
jgi:hypothetical protein